MSAARGIARHSPTLRLIEGDGRWSLQKKGQTLADFGSVSWSLWFRVTGNLNNDATLIQFTKQNWTDYTGSPGLYRQAFRLRWFRSGTPHIAVEIWDTTFNGSAFFLEEGYPWGSDSSTFLVRIPVARGELVHICGCWDRTYGTRIWKNGTLTIDVPLVWPRDIPCAEVNWLAVGGGQDLGTSGEQINKLQGWVGGLWVGFNQIRTASDFITADGKPAAIPGDGDLGDGQPEIWFPMTGPDGWRTGGNEGSIDGIHVDQVLSSAPREVQL